MLVKALALGLSILSSDELKAIIADLEARGIQSTATKLKTFNASLDAGTQDKATIYDALNNHMIAYGVAYMLEENGKAEEIVRRYQEQGRNVARLIVGEWELLETTNTSNGAQTSEISTKYYNVLKQVNELHDKQMNEKLHQKLLAEIKKRLDSDRQTSDDLNRSKRRAVWNDALRESCICQDRLYAFVRQLSGTISENVDAICQIDEGLLVRQQREQRESQQRLSVQAAQEQMALVKNVFGAVLRDSGLSLGIDTKDKPSKLKVVSSTLRKQAAEIASGSEGMSGLFSNSVRLENLLSSGTGEITLEELFEKLGAVGSAIQKAARGADSQYDDETDAVSLDFLSAPRNSLLLRYKPEALAAIRQAFQYFQREMTHQTPRYTRRISAFELIEGCDDALCTAFATFCAHVLVHSRMYSSGTAMYIGAWPAAANAQQLKLSLQRLVTCAREYVWRVGTPGFGSRKGRESYFASCSTLY
jgi:hypothetical protein